MQDTFCNKKSIQLKRLCSEPLSHFRENENKENVFLKNCFTTNTFL